MTDEERGDEGAEEAIEDLEAPAEEQDDVAGGKCREPTGACPKPTQIRCPWKTCEKTNADCTQNSGVIVVDYR